jgi:hypothetical protein
MSETELSITPKKDEVEEQPKRRGRPRTVNITDKKEYLKRYYDNNRETLSEQKKQYYLENKDKYKEYRDENKDKITEYQKEYIEKLKTNEPEKFKDLRQKQKVLSSEAHKKERDAYKLLKTLIKDGIISLPESHKDKILELIN